MPTLRILLIEDTPSDQVLFVNQVQNESGVEVSVDCACTLSEAFSYLESSGVEHYDQVWLDPGLPDLKPNAIGQVLARLKQYVEPSELRLLSSSASPEIRRQASQQSVAVLHKDALVGDSNSEILAVLRSLATKRSSGSTVKIEQARQEGRILTIENAIQYNSGRLDRLETTLSNFSTLRFELESIKSTIAPLPQIQAALSEIKKTQEQQGALKLKRLDVFQAVAIAVITGLLTVVVPKLIELQTPKASPSPTSSVSPSTAK